MFTLAIPQTNTSFFLFLIRDFILFLVLLVLFSIARKLADSLFISDLIHNFTQIKVKEIASHLIKFYTSHSDMLMLR